MHTLYIEFATPQHVASGFIVCNLKVLFAEEDVDVRRLPIWIQHCASLIMCIETGKVFKSTLVQAASLEDGFKLGDSSVANFEVLGATPTVELGNLYATHRGESLKLIAELVITKEEDLVIHHTAINPTAETVKIITDWVAQNSSVCLEVEDTEGSFLCDHRVCLISSSIKQYHTDKNRIITFSTYKV